MDFREVFNVRLFFRQAVILKWRIFAMILWIAEVVINGESVEIVRFSVTSINAFFA